MAELIGQVFLDGYLPSYTTGASVPVSLDGSGQARTSLPTGSATSALQTAGNTSLSHVDGYLNTLAALKSGQTGTLTTALNILDILPVAKYNATRPILMDGYLTEAQASFDGSLSVQEHLIPQYEDNTNQVAFTSPRALSSNTGVWTNYESGTTLIGTVGLVIKSTPGRIRMIGGANTSTADGYYLCVVDKATAPVANDTVIASIYLPAKIANVTPVAIPLDFGVDGIYCTLGVSYALSTTPHKITLPGVAYSHIWARYL